MIKKFIYGLSLLVCFMFCFSACSSPFTNPGDYLGGGGSGTTPVQVDNSEEESQIASSGTIDFSSISQDTTKSDSIKTLDASYLNTSNVYEITESGDYLVTGEYNNKIYVNKSLSVHLFMENATINVDGDIALEVKKDGDLTITVLGTNLITNNSDNAIDSKSPLTINGSGTLTVNSSGKNSIKCSKDVKIVDSLINITSVNHGIAARTISAENCNINVVSAVKDGLNAECDDETNVYTTAEGYVTLKNVNYTCNVQGDGIYADTFVYIDGGEYNITTTATFVSKTSTNMSTYDLVSDDFRYIKSGSTYQKVADDYRGGSTLYAMTASTKGIKVGEIEYDLDDDGEDDGTVTSGNYYILVNSGTFTLDTADDAIHANSGNISLLGGIFNIATLDDAITADYLLSIKSGTINISSCYEGLEGSYVEISGGSIEIVSSDDGINAATDYNVTPYMVISGGSVNVNAGGDGLDSNGSILISGGTLIVNGPTNGADAGMDADSGIIIKGGTVFVSSTLGMVETPSSNSTQCVISFAQSSSISAGTLISIVDSNGNILFETTTKKSCQSIIVSLPNFSIGSTYSIYGGSTLLKAFEVTKIITTLSSSNSISRPGNRPF